MIELVLSMRLEIAGNNLNKGKTQSVSSCVLKVIVEFKCGFIQGQYGKGKQVDETDGSESMNDQFGLTLLHLEFQENGMEPIFELQHSFLAG